MREWVLAPLFPNLSTRRWCVDNLHPDGLLLGKVTLAPIELEAV